MNLGPEKVDYIPPIHKTESRPRSSKTGSLLLPTLTYFPWIFIKPKKGKITDHTQIRCNRTDEDDARPFSGSGSCT